MPAAKDKHEVDEPMNPATAAHQKDDKPDAPKAAAKDKPESGHFDDLTDGKMKPAAKAVDAEPDPSHKDAEAREHDKDVDPAVLPDHMEAAAPEPPRQCDRTIEDLLADKRFDREGKVRPRLAAISAQGVGQLAPVDLVDEHGNAVVAKA